MLSSSEREVWAKEEGPGVNVRRGEGPGRGTILGCLCERLADPLPRAPLDQFKGPYFTVCGDSALFPSFSRESVRMVLLGSGM